MQALSLFSLVPRPFYVRTACFHLEKGPDDIQRLRACHFHGILYSSVYFLYISGVEYVMNIGWSQSMVSIATMPSSIAIV